MNLVQVFIKGDHDEVFRQVDETHNLRTNDGIDYAARQLGGAVGSAAVYMALASSAISPLATDRSLGSSTQGVTTNEFTANGLARTAATYAHTSGITSYTLSHVFTYTGGPQVVVYGVGEFNSATPSGSVLFLETAMSPQTLNTNNQLQIIHTVQI